ncbi:hypothetical protein GCM10011380_09380 [Sphingomonas metalli]|uniref:Uncharacterized protein n=1 Tax=Sphingomonas metalli TaxID=1779358 RepID=A0A916SX13_9SPHN|nr:hypothetical protein [Sphingomonas metalli]GGB21941.1 hypothetical protein GCM10011380_09380 [Sphingomonas metalli]
MTLRPLAALIAAGAALAAPVAAQVAPFDLTGPQLTVTVARGKTVLPVAEVPNLAAGDRLTVAADLPADQSARYLLVVAFLRGATNPPPKNWFFEAETWKPKKNRLTITVPAGAGQAIAFLAPATGGDFGTLLDAVRGRPGAFVRASQDLNQASLDRARLDAYVAGINRRDTEGGVRLEQVSPLLARSLSIRLKDECLTRPPESQAGCLTGGSEALILSDGHSTTLAEALTGTPTDLAYQLSATPQGGYGYYSPYIGVIRDVARLLGAFRTASFQYIPALATHEGDRLKLLLNAVPSFSRPKSVLVAALPPVSPPVPPPLRATHPDARLCLTRPGLVLPVEGAPLIHATRYARDLSLRLTAKDGREIDLPLASDAERGGLTVAVDTLRPDDFEPDLVGRIHGRWGFEPFEGPRLSFQIPRAAGWRTPEGADALVVGRDNVLALAGPGAACVEGMTLTAKGSAPRPVAFEAKDGLVATLPLAGMAPGPMTLSVRLAGLGEPVTIPLTAYAEAGRVDGFTLHAGDAAGVLAGGRLDTVAALTVEGMRFRPGGLSRAGGSDRLEMQAETAPALAPGERAGRVSLVDGRTLPVRVTVAPPRPVAALIARTVASVPVAGTLPVALPDGALAPGDRLTFSLRTGATTRLSPGDRVEVASDATRALLPLQLQDAGVGIATLVPGEALGPAAAGPLRWRLVQGDAAGDWQPLATLVRLPRIREAACADGRCVIKGRDLFLLAALGPVSVPDGFTGEALSLPATADGRLALQLRDAPGLAASVAVGS